MAITPVNGQILLPGCWAHPLVNHTSLINSYPTLSHPPTPSLHPGQVLGHVTTMSSHAPRLTFSKLLHLLRLVACDQLPLLTRPTRQSKPYKKPKLTSNSDVPSQPMQRAMLLPVAHLDHYRLSLFLAWLLNPPVLLLQQREIDFTVGPKPQMIVDPGQPNHNLTSDKSPLPVFIPLPVCRLSLDHYWLSLNQFFLPNAQSRLWLA